MAYTTARLPTLTEASCVFSAGALALGLQIAAAQHFTRSTLEQVERMRDCVVDAFQKSGFDIAARTTTRTTGSVVGMHGEGQRFIVNFSPGGATTIAYNVQAIDDHLSEARQFGALLARQCVERSELSPK
jgi:hypothetical protein